MYAGESMRGAERGCMLDRARDELSEGVCWRESMRGAERVCILESRARVYAREPSEGVCLRAERGVAAGVLESTREEPS